MNYSSESYIILRMFMEILNGYCRVLGFRIALKRSALLNTELVHYISWYQPVPAATWHDE